MMRISNGWGLGLLVALLAAGCGGAGHEGDGGGVIVAPGGPPTPRPTPIATPTPTPTPAGPVFAGVAPGGYLSGPAAFGSGAIIGAADRTSIGFPNVQYIAPDHYALEPAGFGGPELTPDEQGEPANDIYDFAGESADGYGYAVEIYTGTAAGRFAYMTFGTIADISSSGSVIGFYTAGRLDGDVPAAGVMDYGGLVDGLAVADGSAARLFGTDVAVRIDYGRRAVQLAIDLVAHADPFGMFRAAPATALGRIDVTMPLADGHFRSERLAGPGGHVGSLSGRLFGPAAAELGIAFELAAPNGDRMIGIVAARRSAVR